MCLRQVTLHLLITSPVVVFLVVEKPPFISFFIDCPQLVVVQLTVNIRLTTRKETHEQRKCASNQKTRSSCMCRCMYVNELVLVRGFLSQFLCLHQRNSVHRVSVFILSGFLPSKIVSSDRGACEREHRAETKGSKTHRILTRIISFSSAHRSVCLESLTVSTYFLCYISLLTERRRDGTFAKLWLMITQLLCIVVFWACLFPR